MARAASASPIFPERNEPISWPQSRAELEKSEGATFSRDMWSVFTIGKPLIGVTARAIHRVRKAAFERPLYLVGGVAVASFLAGIALRIWRSRQYD